MATSYTGLRVQDTYNAIIKIGDNSNLTGTAKLLSDGLGNDSPLYLSTSRLGIGITPAYQFHTTGNAKIGGDVIISGDLTVNGDLTYLNVTDLQVEDPLIKLAKDNTSNTLDIGFFGKYVESATTKYTGLFWDASTDKFRLYEGLQVEPTTTVDVTGTGYTRSLLNADLEGNVTGTVSSLSNHDTNDLVEGSFNQYFTTARARASFSAGDGITITNGVIASEGDAEVAKRIDVTVKNVSGGSLAKGVVVHASPTATPPSGNVIEVIAADANVASSMPAIGILNETIADEAEGEAVMFGAVSGIDTSGFSIGDELYVSETVGLLTATKPTAFGSQVQKIAVVIKSHASNGLIKVFGAGRANDVPNRVDRDMNFTDDSELTFGDSSDLKIYHTTNNIVRINSGDLIFNSFVTDGDIKFQLDNGSGSLTEYMRLDGGTENIVFSKSVGGTLNLSGNLDMPTAGSQIMVNAYNAGQQEGGGIFFRDGFDVNNKYNLSIMARSKVDDGSPDGLSINANEGIAFSTGSDSYNERMYIDNSGNVGIGIDAVSKFHLKYSGGSYGADSTSGFINQAETGRATQRIRSIDDEAAELFFDVDGGIAWDISARDSSSSYDLMFYGRGSTVGYNQVAGPYVRFHQTGNVTISGSMNVQGTSGSTFYGIDFQRSGSGVTTPDIWGNGNTLVLGHNSSTPVIKIDTTQTTFVGDVIFPTVQISNGQSYNENIRMFPSANNDYSSLVLGAVSGTGGTGTGQWTLVRYPAANSNKFTIRHNTLDIQTFTTNGNAFFANRLGVGNTSPTARLSVNEPVGSSDSRTTPVTVMHLGTSHPDVGYNGFGTSIVDYRRTYQESGLHAVNSIDFIERGDSSNDFGGAIDFNTKALSSGTVAPVRRMRIDYTGKIGINTTSIPGLLTIKGTSSGNAPLLRINADTSSSFVHSTESIAANLTASQTVINVIGKEGTTKQSGWMGYQWYGTGSNDNLLTFGMWGANHLLTINGLGHTNIAGNLTVNGNYSFNGLLLNTYTGTGYHELQNSTSNGTVLRLLSTGDSRTLTLQTDHIYSNGNLYFGDASYQLRFRGSYHYYESGLVGIGILPTTMLQVYSDSDIWHMMVGGATKKLLVGGQAATGDVVLQAGAANTPNNAAVTTAYNLTLQRDGGKVGIGAAPSTSDLLLVKGSSGSDVSTRFMPYSNNAKSTLFLSSVSSGDGGYFYDSNDNTSGLFAYGDYTFYVGTGNLSGAGPANPRMTITQAGRVGIGNQTPTEKPFEVNGGILVYTSRSGYDADGIFFREGFTSGVLKYNCSILAKDHSGASFPDGLSINGYDGISFCTGSNDRNQVGMFDVNGNFGVGIDPVSKLHLKYSGGDYGTEATSGFINEATTGRATMRLRSLTDNASELFFDVNGAIRWDVSTRNSGEGYQMNFYPQAATPVYNSVSAHTFHLKQNGDAYHSGSVGIGSSPTAKLSVIGAGTGNNPTLAVDCTSSSTFNHAVEVFAGNMTAGESVISLLGHSGSTRNSGYLGYIYSSNSSYDNQLTLGFWSNDHLVRLRPNGNFGIGVNPSYTLDVAGAARLKGYATAILRFDTDGADASNYVGTINQYENAVYCGRGSAGFLVAGNSNIRFGFGSGVTLAQSKMVINPGGQVNIGTSSNYNGTRLNVEGDRMGVRTSSSSWGQLYVANPNDAEVGIAFGAGGTGRPGGTSTYTRQWIMGLSPFSTGTNKFSITNKTLQGNPALTIIENTGAIGLRKVSPSYQLDVTGDIRASSDVIAFSDRRVKENIVTIDNALEKVAQLRGVTYTRKDTDDKSTKLGVIAQEVLEVLPEIVAQDKDGMYSVAYGNMAGVFIEAIKELKAEVNSLKKEIKELKK